MNPHTRHVPAEDVEVYERYQDSPFSIGNLLDVDWFWKTLGSILIVAGGVSLIIYGIGEGIGAIAALYGFNKLQHSLCSLDNRFRCWNCWRLDRRYTPGGWAPVTWLRETAWTYAGPLGLLTGVALWVAWEVLA